MKMGIIQCRETRAAAFAEALRDVEPIRLTDPLAELLGAFVGGTGVLEYAYTDVVKLTGHACPTTAMAFECCRAALKRLYPDRLPVRGAVSIAIHGEPDEGVYGVIGQVFSLITGAAPATGFKGLATHHRRKDLLQYAASGAAEPDDGLRFRFKRTDTGAAVTCRIAPDRAPAQAPDDQRRLGELLRKVLWDAADAGEAEEFRRLWRQGVAAVFASAGENGNPWLTIQETTR